MTKLHPVFSHLSHHQRLMPHTRSSFEPSRSRVETNHYSVSPILTSTNERQYLSRSKKVVHACSFFFLLTQFHRGHIHIQPLRVAYCYCYNRNTTLATDGHPIHLVVPLSNSTTHLKT